MLNENDKNRLLLVDFECRMAAEDLENAIGWAIVSFVANSEVAHLHGLLADPIEAVIRSMRIAAELNDGSGPGDPLWQTKPMAVLPIRDWGLTWEERERLTPAEHSYSWRKTLAGLLRRLALWVE